ncbi:MAG: hypothetical protein IJV72_01515 [Clostridia bacterium]|nr:hypothetical protein [Clostridia bacterium]
MKKRIAQITACLLLVTSLLAVFGGCKKNEGDQEGDETTLSSLGEEVKAQYNRDPEDLGGFELNILAVKSGHWNMHTDLAPTTYNGEAINSAVYERNQNVQSLYNAKIVAHEDAEWYGMTNRFAQDQLSGEYIYDAAYVEASSVMSLITQNSLKNLYDIPELQLDQEWWSQLIKEEATLGSGKYSTLYFTQSNLSLTSFDLTWCVYFNKAVHEKEHIEDLYALVKNDQWTIEKMKGIAQEVASLNTDDDFTYRSNGTSFYGITTYWNGVKAMLDGGNVQFVTTDANDEPISNIANERFTNLSQDLARLCGESGTFTYGGPSADGKTIGNASDYINIFNTQRSLFCVAEVKSSVSDFKTFDGDFGILPLPKYDNTQTEYRSWVNYLAPVLVISETLEGGTLHNTATLLDALSFYSDRDVLPVYYDTVLKGRGAKDAESVEMLDVINQTKSFDASIAYGWSREFSERVSETILQGVTDVSSLIASYDSTITTNIKDTLDKIYKD